MLSAHSQLSATVGQYLIQHSYALKYILVSVNVLVLLWYLSGELKQSTESKAELSYEQQPISRKVLIQELPEATVPPPVRRPHYDARWSDNWDGLHEAWETLQRLGRKQVYRRIFLVRNGQYYAYGPAIWHLSDTGKEQARLTGERLKDIGVVYDRLVTSSTLRAVETAEILQKYMPNVRVVQAGDLVEGIPSHAEPGIQIASEHWYPSEQKYMNDSARIEKAFTDYVHRPPSYQQKDSTEVMVTHGNIISYFILRALQVHYTRWQRLSLFQASISLIVISSDGQVSVRFFGDVGHLPPSLWTG